MGFQRDFKGSYPSYVLSKAESQSEKAEFVEMTLAQPVFVELLGAGPCNSSDCQGGGFRPDED